MFSDEWNFFMQMSNKVCKKVNYRRGKNFVTSIMKEEEINLLLMTNGLRNHMNQGKNKIVMIKETNK
jgi:hypothetical protein